MSLEMCLRWSILGSTADNPGEKADYLELIWTYWSILEHIIPNLSILEHIIPNLSILEHIIANLSILEHIGAYWDRRLTILGRKPMISILRKHFFGQSHPASTSLSVPRNKCELFWIYKGILDFWPGPLKCRWGPNKVAFTMYKWSITGAAFSWFLCGRPQTKKLWCDVQVINSNIPWNNIIMLEIIKKNPWKNMIFLERIKYSLKE